MATVNPRANEIVAHMRGVRDAVDDELEQRASRVRAVVAAHRRTGQLASGTGVSVGRTDSQVYMEHPAVHAINYGHVKRGGTGWVDGIHAIEAAL